MATLIPNGRIWIDTEEGAFLGYGRIELLETVIEQGSIRKAAEKMKMSYQHAWHLIDQLNKRADSPLIVVKRGGKGGGSVELTEKGQKAITLFHEFNMRFQDFLKNERLNL